MVRFALALGLAVLCLGCADEPVTEIFACYSVDPALHGPGGSLRLRVFGADGRRQLYDSSLGALGPGELTHGYVQSSESGILLELEADVPVPTGSTTIVQRARVPFQRDRIVDVALRIELGCRDRSCAADTTCVGGTCLPVDVDPACLPDHGEPASSECTDPRVTRGCGSGADAGS